MESAEKKTMQTKWKRMMESKKGGMEYNPNQSFGLHVDWIVRSPRAAKEMIEKGFKPCSQATQRDTPTTLCYLFRVSRDQSLAQKLKDEVKTIGQHPHYLPAFKSLEMGIPRAGVEMKLKNGGINLAPLSWDPSESISGHEKELDFDPVVLECTEIYLDDRAFYEHAASADWMKYSPEILLPSRSLKPRTFCVGNPSQQIWDSTLLPSLKAIRFDESLDNQIITDIKPGLFFSRFDSKNDSFIFFDFELVTSFMKVRESRQLLEQIRSDLNCFFMFIFPTSNLEDVLNDKTLQLKVMLCFSTFQQKSDSLSLLRSHCEIMNGRMIFFDSQTNSLSNQGCKDFLKENGLSELLIEIWNGKDAASDSLLAGYPLHPLFQQLVPDSQFHYQL